MLLLQSVQGVRFPWLLEVHSLCFASRHSVQYKSTSTVKCRFLLDLLLCTVTVFVIKQRNLDWRYNWLGDTINCPASSLVWVPIRNSRCNVSTLSSSYINRTNISLSHIHNLFFRCSRLPPLFTLPYLKGGWASIPSCLEKLRHEEGVKKWTYIRFTFGRSTLAQEVAIDDFKEKSE